MITSKNINPSLGDQFERSSITPWVVYLEGGCGALMLRPGREPNGAKHRHGHRGEDVRDGDDGLPDDLPRGRQPRRLDPAAGPTAPPFKKNFRKGRSQSRGKNFSDLQWPSVNQVRGPSVSIF